MKKKKKIVLIEGGYYITPRILSQSKIQRKPPHYREIWDCIRRHVSHSDNGVYKAGQWNTKKTVIQKELSWIENRANKQYSEKQIRAALNWMVDEGMITIVNKTKGGITITVVDHAKEANPNNYKNAYIIGSSNIMDDSSTNGNDNDHDDSVIITEEMIGRVGGKAVKYWVEKIPVTKYAPNYPQLTKAFKDIIRERCEYLGTSEEKILASFCEYINGFFADSYAKKNRFPLRLFISQFETYRIEDDDLISSDPGDDDIPIYGA